MPRRKKAELQNDSARPEISNNNYSQSKRITEWLNNIKNPVSPSSPVQDDHPEEQSLGTDEDEDMIDEDTQDMDTQDMDTQDEDMVDVASLYAELINYMLRYLFDESDSEESSMSLSTASTTTSSSSSVIPLIMKAAMFNENHPANIETFNREIAQLEAQRVKYEMKKIEIMKKYERRMLEMEQQGEHDRQAHQLRMLELQSTMQLMPLSTSQQSAAPSSSFLFPT